MKKLHLSRILLIASFITLFAISCKKDQSADNPVEDAKSWYLKSTANTKSSLKSNRGAIKDVTQDIQWNNAQLYNLEDGTEVLGTPMVITLDKGIKAKGSYMLLISKTNGAYSSLIAYNENKDYFNSSLTASTVKKIYKSTLELSLAHKDMSVSRSNSNPNNKLMTVPAEDYCIDWYLTTYLYDEWGNVVEILSEVYLYTTCIENGGGGGGGGVEPEEPVQPALHTLEDTEFANGTLIEYTTSGVAKRKWSDSWRFGKGEYLNMTFFGYSTELCEMKYENGNWEWESITNQSYYTAGQRPDGTEFVKDGYAANYFDHHADLQFTSHIAYLNRGPRATSPKSTYHKINKR